MAFMIGPHCYEEDMDGWLEMLRDVTGARGHGEGLRAFPRMRMGGEEDKDSTPDKLRFAQSSLCELLTADRRRLIIAYRRFVMRSRSCSSSAKISSHPSCQRVSCGVF
jgi:hypothetical protein